MKEYKIGEIFKHGDTWLQCVKDGDCCFDCFFNKEGQCLNDSMIACSIADRSDRERVIFKELPEELPVGLEFIYQDKKLRVEEYKGIEDETIKLLSKCKKCALCDNDGECLIDEYFPPCFGGSREDEKNIIYREVTDAIKETKHKTIKFNYMEPERKKLTIPDGWEFDKLENGEIILKTKEPTLPDTWEDCMRVIEDVEYMDYDTELITFKVSDLLKEGELDEENFNSLPRGMGKPMLALCQLLICRNAWWKKLGWKPDWKEDSLKYVIEIREGAACGNAFYSLSHVLAFPTKEVRDKFLESFKDLIEEAKELL